jgi:hypothetical protein
MGIQFDWQAGDDNGQWETIAERRRRAGMRWVPRWAWYALIAAIVVSAAGGLVAVRRRYEQAQRQIVFQIQGVIDLEAHAFAQGKVDLYLAQQDSASPDWYDLQHDCIQTHRASQATRAAAHSCSPVLPAAIQDVDLRGDVAWVEVIEGAPPVRRVRFYRRTDLGWKHTAPRVAFWDNAVELHYGDLLFRYHERDQPHVDPLIEHIVRTFYQVCARVECPPQRSLEVNFAVDPFLPTDAPPPLTDTLWLLPSPWLSGLPVEGTWQQSYLDALAYRVVHEMAGPAYPPLRQFVFSRRAVERVHSSIGYAAR